MEIERIYSEFLDFKNKDYKEKHKGLEKHFSASSAGSCYKKHLFKITDAPLKDFEERSQRIMRLGTLVHQDFEDSMKHYLKENKDIYATSTQGEGVTTIFYNRNEKKEHDYTFYLEHKIIIPELNIAGHLDFAVINKQKKEITVYDYKTAGTYKWSLKFGRKYKDKNPNFNYEMQLSTYLMGLESELQFTPEVKQMLIVWYNKDTSRMREEVIQSRFIEMARSYWEDLNEWRKEIENKDPELEDYNNVNETISRYREVGVPFQDWECKYCPYDHICK